MGTPMAPTIANIFMGWLEQRLLANSPWPIDREFWRRFIDDILLLWTHGEERLHQFLDWINNQHSSIKFTANYGRTNIPYLDVSISVENDRIVTDLHVKKTDAHMYLPFHSCHPRHCLRGIPYGQCVRLRRICSDDGKFFKRCSELKERLQKRGYPESLVNAAINKVSAIPREDTLKYRQKNQSSQRVPFIIRHNPTNPPLASWLKAEMQTLCRSRRMQKAMPQPPIVGERKCRNLRSFLMPSRPPAPKPQRQNEAVTVKGCHKCTAKRCVVCKEHLEETTSFSSVRTGRTFTIRDSANCKSSNLVYLINCARCQDVQYVGETGNTLQVRFNSHRSDIRRK